MPAIYLVRLSPGGFSGPPSGMGRATLLTPVYMTLQLPRRTALASPQGRWALTPPSHPCRRAGARRRLFSSALLHPRGWLSVRKWDALCCPDFPPAPVVQAAGRPTASQGAKVRKQIGAAKGCRKSLSKLSRQVLVKSLFLPYPSLVPLLSLSCSSLIPLLFLSYPSLIPLLSLSYSFLSPPFHLRFRSVFSSFGNAGGMGSKWESQLHGSIGMS